MQLFDSGHLASGLGDFESVANQNYPAVDTQDAGVNTENQSAPGLSDLVQIEARAVQEVEKAVVAGGLQAQCAHDAGDPHHFRANCHSCQTESHPQESPATCAGGPQLAYQSPPLVPKSHEIPPATQSPYSIALICYTLDARKTYDPKTD